MRVLVVDDEQLARGRLVRILERIEGYSVVGEAAHGLEAVKQAQILAPDIMLLDIRMPGMDGLEVARHLAQMEAPPAVIFCTAFEEHAIAAFDVQAVGYLLKPVRALDLEDALARARRANRAQLSALVEEEVGGDCRTHVSARTHRGIELVPVDKVCYFQADHKYVTVRWPDGELLIDDTLRQLEAEFGEHFIRIHRNAIVATKFLSGLERDAQGRYQVRLRGIDECLEVSRRHISGLRCFVQLL